jgi:hypothetical protein
VARGGACDGAIRPGEPARFVLEHLLVVATTKGG